LSVVDKFAEAKLLVIGDLILDNYIWGDVNRVSQEAPVVVVEVKDENKRPGGAANVAHNMKSLGGSVDMCGVVGDDASGRALRALLEELKINCDLLAIDDTRPTTVKTRIIAHAQQVVRVDREVKVKIDEPVSNQIIDGLNKALGAYCGIVVADYAKGVIIPKLMKVLNEAKANGVLGGLEKPIVVDPKGGNFSIYGDVTVMKPNRKEAEEASGMKITDRTSAFAAGRLLLQKWSTDYILITLGDKGMVLISRDSKDSFEVDTVAREVFDVVGAGDTVSATFALSLASGATLIEAAQLANIAAGIAVREIGTVAVTKDELVGAIREHGKVS
jgi:D-glycero-beta-D-manno-heptose-7-phosphate kinase